MFLCLNVSSGTEQHSGSVTIDIKYKALIILQMLHCLWSKWAVLSVLYLLSLVPQLSHTIFWHLPVGILTSLSLTFSYVAGHFQMSWISGLWSPALLPHFSAKNPFSILMLWHWRKWSNSILHAEILSCSEWDPGLDLWGRKLTFGHRYWLDEAEATMEKTLLVSQKALSSWQFCNPTMCLYQHWQRKLGECRNRWKDSWYHLQNASNIRLKAVLFLLAPFL